MVAMMSCHAHCPYVDVETGQWVLSAAYAAWAARCCCCMEHWSPAARQCPLLGR